MLSRFLYLLVFISLSIGRINCHLPPAVNPQGQATGAQVPNPHQHMSQMGISGNPVAGQEGQGAVMPNHPQNQAQLPLGKTPPTANPTAEEAAAMAIALASLSANFEEAEASLAALSAVDHAIQQACKVDHSPGCIACQAREPQVQVTQLDTQFAQAIDAHKDVPQDESQKDLAKELVVLPFFHTMVRCLGEAVWKDNGQLDQNVAHAIEQEEKQQEENKHHETRAHFEHLKKLQPGWKSSVEEWKKTLRALLHIHKHNLHINGLHQHQTPANGGQQHQMGAPQNTPQAQQTPTDALPSTSYQTDPSQPGETGFDGNQGPTQDSQATQPVGDSAPPPVADEVDS